VLTFDDSSPGSSSATSQANGSLSLDRIPVGPGILEAIHRREAPTSAGAATFSTLLAGRLQAHRFFNQARIRGAQAPVTCQPGASASRHTTRVWHANPQVPGDGAFARVAEAQVLDPAALPDYKTAHDRAPHGAYPTDVNWVLNDQQGTTYSPRRGPECRGRPPAASARFSRAFDSGCACPP